MYIYMYMDKIKNIDKKDYKKLYRPIPSMDKHTEIDISDNFKGYKYIEVNSPYELYYTKQIGDIAMFIDEYNYAFFIVNETSEEIEDEMINIMNDIIG